jgi:hypothetical protein
MKWLDRLEEAGRKAVEDARPPRGKPSVERVCVTTRPSDPEAGDPGAARYGWYYVEGDRLTMCDEAGTPLKSESGRPVTVVLEDGADPRAIAASLTKRRSRGDGLSGFERGPLRYPKLRLP